MVIVSSFTSILLLLLSTATAAAASLPFNATIIRLPQPTTLPNYDSDAASISAASAVSTSFLKQVVNRVSEKERWDPKAEVRVLGFRDLESKTTQVGVSQRYQFLVRVGRRKALTLKFEDEIVAWRKNEKGGNGVGPAVELVGSDLVAGDEAAGIKPAVRGLELVGPLELKATGSGDGDGITIHLPALNITHRDVRRIYVGNGIAVKIEDAQEVSLSHPYDIGLSLNGSLAAGIDVHHMFWHLGYSSCTPVLTVQVGGPASVTAYGQSNPAEVFEASLKSSHTLELLPAKCYNNSRVNRISRCSFCSFNSRFTALENVLRSFLGNRIFQDKYVRFLKANITSAVLIKFQLELERDITRNDRSWRSVPEWKQRPDTERIWLKVVAGIDYGRRLKPVIVKRLKRPFHVADSTAWSNLMSNISFTQFSSLVVPPEALTLDVRW